MLKKLLIDLSNPKNKPLAALAALGMLVAYPAAKLSDALTMIVPRAVVNIAEAGLYVVIVLSICLFLRYDRGKRPSASQVSTRCGTSHTLKASWLCLLLGFYLPVLGTVGFTWLKPKRYLADAVLVRPSITHSQTMTAPQSILGMIAFDPEALKANAIRQVHASLVSTGTTELSYGVLRSMVFVCGKPSKSATEIDVRVLDTDNVRAALVANMVAEEIRRCMDKEVVSWADAQLAQAKAMLQVRSEELLKASSALQTPNGQLAQNLGSAPLPKKTLDILSRPELAQPEVVRLFQEQRALLRICDELEDRVDALNMVKLASLCGSVHIQKALAPDTDDYFSPRWLLNIGFSCCLGVVCAFVAMRILQRAQ